MPEQIKKIRVTVSYSVGLGDITTDDKTYKELKDLYELGVTMETNTPSEFDYPNAAQWLIDNIKEKDCINWECEIDQFK